MLWVRRKKKRSAVSRALLAKFCYYFDGLCWNLVLKSTIPYVTFFVFVLGAHKYYFLDFSPWSRAVQRFFICIFFHRNKQNSTYAFYLLLARWKAWEKSFQRWIDQVCGALIPEPGARGPWSQLTDDVRGYLKWRLSTFFPKRTDILRYASHGDAVYDVRYDYNTSTARLNVPVVIFYPSREDSRVVFIKGLRYFHNSVS